MKISLLKRKNRLFKSHGIVFNFFTVIAWVWTLSQFAMILWGFLASLRDPFRYSMQPMRFFPEGFVFHWENYLNVFETMVDTNTGVNYWGMVVNSVWFSIGATFMKLWATTLLAYVMAQYNFFGKKTLYAFLIVQIMLPVYGQTTANYIFLDKLHLINTPLFLLALGAGHGMYFLIMHSYFTNLSSTYREAAELDGANDFSIFFRIMLPLGASSVIAIGIVTFMGNWNDYSTALLYIDAFPTLAVGLYRYQFEAIFTTGFDAPILFAGIFLASLPTTLLFIFFNKTLMENLTIGGIKG